MTAEELEFFPAASQGGPDYGERIRAVFEKHLVKQGLNLTKQRLRILDFLIAAKRHLELDEIYLALRKHGIGRATVFRSLKLLEECGLVDHVTTTKGASRFEIKLERPHHDHLICVECGNIQEVRWPQLEKIQEETCRKLGFAPTWHRHEIFGRCRRCAKA
ncbi:MAG: transcriptional repressor [Elusimicrobia bacterium]|nr:transcriptional repressor [Elusimicrobiota bacterium]